MTKTADQILAQSIAFKKRISAQNAMKNIMLEMARLGIIIDAPEFNEASCKLVALQKTLDHNNWELSWGTPRK